MVGRTTEKRKNLNRYQKRLPRKIRYKVLLNSGIKRETITVCISQTDSNSNPVRSSLYYKIYIGRKTEKLEILETEYDGPSKKPIAKPYKRSSSQCHSSSGTATCNSQLFSIGGDYNCLDITSDSQNEVFTTMVSDFGKTTWEKYPAKLNARRHNPLAITIKDDIYVFGTVNYPSGNLDHFAEVIHTVSKTIKPLKVQPSKASICAGFILCSAVIKKKGETTILLATSNHSYNGPSRLLYYHVKKGSWEDVTESHPNFFSVGSRLSVRSAVIDGVLYTYYSKNVFAYDLDNQKWFDHPVLSLLEEEECYFKYDNDKGFVLDLGNQKLCVGFCTSFPDGGEGEASKLLLHYALFTPQIDSKVRSKRAHTSIQALVHAKGYHVLYGRHFVDAVNMQAKQVSSPNQRFPLYSLLLTMVECLCHRVGLNNTEEINNVLQGIENLKRQNRPEKHKRHFSAIGKFYWNLITHALEWMISKSETIEFSKMRKRLECSQNCLRVSPNKNVCIADFFSNKGGRILYFSRKLTGAEIEEYSLLSAMPDTVVFSIHSDCYEWCDGKQRLCVKKNERIVVGHLSWQKLLRYSHLPLVTDLV